MNSLLQFINKSSILAWYDGMFEGIEDFIGTLVWGLCDIFFVIIDLFETIFRKFAGIDTVMLGNGKETITGDLVLYAIKSDIVQQIFTSILVLSLFLLIIFTILAIAKNQYSDKQEPVSKIIGSSVKALLMYLLVPVGVIVGLLAGNVVLVAIDGATKATSGGGTASTSIFNAAAYNANRLREASLDVNRANLKLMIEKGYFDKASSEFVLAMTSLGVDVTDKVAAVSVTASQMEGIAQLIDESFADGSLGEDANKWSFHYVKQFYIISEISIVITWIGGGFLIFNLGKMCWGLIARLFKMTLYFAISPALMATFPLNGDRALSAWRGEMIKNATMAYCAVGVLNVLYSILPFIKQMDFGLLGIGNFIIRIFIYIVAFSSAKELVSTISGWFGTGNAIEEGAKAQGKMTMKNIAHRGMRTVAGVTAGWKAAGKNKGNRVAGAFRGLVGSFGGDKSWAEQFSEMEEGITRREESKYKDGKRVFGVLDRFTPRNETFRYDSEGKKIETGKKDIFGRDKYEKMGLKERIARDGLLGGKRAERMREERASIYAAAGALSEVTKETDRYGWEDGDDDVPKPKNIHAANQTTYAQQITQQERMEKATKEAERDEIQGFYAAVKEFAGAVKKMKESQTERDDAIKSIFGVKDASKVSTKAREAFMSNDREQMMRLIEGARTKKEKGILEHALAQMTAYSAEKLKELVDTATASEKTMARSKREYEAEIASDSRLKAFVDAKGLQANEATIVGASKSVETEIKGLNREIRDLGETISRLGYEAVKRARTGGQTEEDRKRLKAAAESKK